ncbi:UDP-N-acetylmuramoyl-L-alanyl-D-glutamate--2,6-diaminopimelate ligase [Virgibacillus byunsanensis]|uniref:UDP-N-acetylmuramyl-tripeptide synthetase n=1 Tax=Virgibacillus byunsanensis TaxID=570945 RepID=A0ABW3LML0_9BACI
MNTHELLSCLRFKKINGALPNHITNIHQDSRKVENDTMFICIRGFTVDGHEYYKDAIENGATVILAEEELKIDSDHVALVIVNSTAKAMALLANKFFDYPSTKLTTIGVTGTNGKTTVTSLIHSILRNDNQKSALSGSIGLELGKEFYYNENTTCDALTNQKMLRKVHDQGVDHMIMEVSSHGLAQGRLWGIDFDIVVFTNLTHDHLDYHNTMEQYSNTKSLLFSQLGNDLSAFKCLILNEDDPQSNQYKAVTPFESISYSIENTSDFKATNIIYKSDMTSFTLHSPEGTYDVEMKLLGKFNIYNVLAATASLYAKGITVERLVELIKKLSPVNGRMEKVNISAPVTMYIDYAHTPDAIEKSISSVMPFKKQKIIFLAGTSGDRDRYKRPLMAEKASLADYVILTVNDPRFENATTILADMEQGMQHHHYKSIPDRKKAITHAIEVSEPGDIIILAGKGQEEYQIIENKKYPHSDIKIATEKCLLKYSLNHN